MIFSCSSSFGLRTKWRNEKEEGVFWMLSHGTSDKCTMYVPMYQLPTSNVCTFRSIDTAWIHSIEQFCVFLLPLYFLLFEHKFNLSIRRRGVSLFFFFNILFSLLCCTDVSIRVRLRLPKTRWFFHLSHTCEK